MSLERAMTRLSLRPASICRQCRRTFTSPAKPRQQQSATGAIAETLQTSRAATPTATPQREQPGPNVTTDAAPMAGRDAFAFARTAVRNMENSKSRTRQEEEAAALARSTERRGLESQQTRRWLQGDVYAPRDIGGVEQAKWKKLKAKDRTRWDIVDQLNIKPMDHYKNFSVMSEYVTDMGKISHRTHSGLRHKNQRKMAKAVRRAIGIGLIPAVYKHPEILKEAPEYQRRRRAR